VNEAAFTRTLAAARLGDHEASAALCNAYAGRILSAVRRRLHPELRRKLDSTDIVQSVFAELLRDLPRFDDRGEVAFRHWLYLKAENKVRAKLRRYLGAGGVRVERSLDDVQELDGRDTGPAAMLANRERSAFARALRAELDEGARRIVLARVEDELSFAEIAERFALPSADAARKRYARAIETLRRLGRVTEPPR
jgi:RNA polymerase sigma factor (sigma-70 family)